MLLKYMDSIEETNIIDSIIETPIIDSIVETTIIDSIEEPNSIDSIEETNIINSIEKNIKNDELLKKLNVLIFCGGKCGGTTLSTTFKNNGYNTLHMHSSTCFGLYNPNYYDLHKISTFYVIDYNANKNKLYIIDSYRTPIERKISSFFQNITFYVPNYKTQNIYELIDIFNSLFNKLETYHSIDEVLNHYHLPLFKTFDFDNKYNMIEKDNMVFIKLRFNDIDEWSNILSVIFQKNITIYSKNLTKNKNIANLYNEFKNTYKIPKQFLKDILKIDHFLIYNTLEEQQKYIEYWENNSI